LFTVVLLYRRWQPIVAFLLAGTHAEPFGKGMCFLSGNGIINDFLGDYFCCNVLPDRLFERFTMIR
jgi:hypothetical protein